MYLNRHGISRYIQVQDINNCITIYIVVHPGISKYIRCISWYILVCLGTSNNTVCIASFGAQHDAAVRDSVQPPVLQPPLELDDADPCPEPEDEEFFQGPDAESKEEAIKTFWMGWRVGNAGDWKTFTDFLTVCLCQLGLILEACLILTPGKADSYLTWMRISRKDLRYLSSSCTSMHWNTGCI
jgi:hypothetical protein